MVMDLVKDNIANGGANVLFLRTSRIVMQLDNHAWVDEYFEIRVTDMWWSHLCYIQGMKRWGGIHKEDICPGQTTPNEDIPW